MIRYCQYRNANGAYIYTRPTGQNALTMPENINRTTLDGLEPRATHPQRWGIQALVAPRHGSGMSSPCPKSSEASPLRH
jgi:hypothetical protein